MKKILLMCFSFALVFNVWAQDRVVSGKVTSAEDGSALPGVSVVLKGTTVGTQTDSDGNYKLILSAEGGILIFSFIGMTTSEVVIGERTLVDVSLGIDVKQLSEVVVTAIGIQKDKNSLGYSVESVNPNKLQQVSEPDPLRALQGKVSGVNISGSSGVAGSATRITIRGNNSLLGNNQPLFVVDGVPFNNDTQAISNQLNGGGAFASGIAGLDPNNIASVSILKGGAAAALYGSRAANGVVVITTKTGTSKPSSKGLELTFNSSTSIETISNLPDYQNTYGTGTKFAYGAVNGSWGAAFDGAAGYPTQKTIDLWGPIADAYPNNTKTVPYQAYPNNVKDFFKTGRVYDNSISFQGGDSKANFSGTISRLDNDSYIPSSKFERTNISVGANTVLENKLSIGGSFSYINTVQTGPPGGSQTNNLFNRLLYLGRSWDLQGQPFEDPITHASVFFVDKTQSSNPYWTSKYDGFTQKNNRVLANLNFGYDITPWLNLILKGGVNTYSQKGQQWYRPGSAVNGGLGQLIDDYLTYTEIETNLVVNTHFDLTPDLHIRALLGQNFNQRTSDRQAYRGSEFIDFNILDIDNTKSQVKFGGDYTRRRILGAYIDGTLDYKGYLFLNFTGRNDVSSTLPKANNSYFYPAASASFVFTEGLKINSKVLSYGKVRAGISRVGKDADPYLLSYTYSINPLINNNSPSFSLPFNNVAGSTYGDQAVNPKLTPEFTTEIEVGTELQFFNNRFGFDLTLYDKRTRDQIAPITVPGTSGFTSYLTNIGEISNKGIEVGVNGTPLQFKNGFKWLVSGNFTRNLNVVESLAPGVDEVIIGSYFSGSVTPITKAGAQYGVLKGTVDARDDEGNLLIDPSNGQLIRAKQQALIGNPNPDYIVGLTNTFSYKGFTLNLLFDYRHGGNLYSQTAQLALGRGVLKDTENREKNVVIPGVWGDVNTGQPLRDAEGKKIVNNIQIEMNDLYFGETFAVNGADEWSVYDATVLRFREVGLTYQLPKEILSKTPFGSISIGLTGRNLFYKAPGFPKSLNFDPESNTLGASNAQGLEYLNAPSVKRFGINLKATF